MRITPLDVRKQEFRRGMRGLDPEEVYAFLSTVADEYEAVLNDNKALRERLLELDDKVQEYRSMEKTLRDTLLTAERVNVEAKDNARREANLIIKEAQIEAEKSLRDIKTDAMKLRQQVQQLRSQRDSFLARMRVAAEAHMSYIESTVHELSNEDEVISAIDLADAAEDTPRVSPGSEDARGRESGSNLFDAASDAASGPDARHAAGGDAQREPERQAPTPPPPSSNAPRASAVETPVAGNAPHAGPTVSPSSLDPISVIIDRMKQGQQAILGSRAGVPDPGFESRNDAPSAPSGDAETDRGTDTATAVEEQRGEVTSQFSLDDIRRELEAEEKEK